MRKICLSSAEGNPGTGDSCLMQSHPSKTVLAGQSWRAEQCVQQEPIQPLGLTSHPNRVTALTRDQV